MPRRQVWRVATVLDGYLSNKYNCAETVFLAGQRLFGISPPVPPPTWRRLLVREWGETAFPGAKQP